MNRSGTFSKLLLRVGVYCIGLIVIAVGVTLSVNSNLGVSPVNSLPYVISQITGVRMGLWVTACFCVYILLQALILRKEFKLINVLQIVFATLFGYLVELANFLLADFVLPTYAGKLVMLAASIFLIALGVQLYLDAQLVPMPMEGLAACLAKKLGKPFSTMKSIVDCLAVVVGVILCVVFLGRLVGIREGTIITAVMVGRTTGILKKWVSPLVHRICFE